MNKVLIVGLFSLAVANGFVWCAEELAEDGIGKLVVGQSSGAEDKELISRLAEEEAGQLEWLGRGNCFKVQYSLPSCTVEDQFGNVEIAAKGTVHSNEKKYFEICLKRRISGYRRTFVDVFSIVDFLKAESNGRFEFEKVVSRLKSNASNLVADRMKGVDLRPEEEEVYHRDIDDSSSEDEFKKYISIYYDPKSKSVTGKFVEYLKDSINYETFISKDLDNGSFTEPTCEETTFPSGFTWPGNIKGGDVAALMREIDIFTANKKSAVKVLAKNSR